MADSLSYTLGTASSHLLPRLLRLCPVAAPRYTLTTRDKAQTTPHIWGLSWPTATNTPSSLFPRVYITAHCKRTVSYLQPRPQLIGTFFVDRGQIKFTHSMGRKILPRRKSRFVWWFVSSEDTAKPQQISIVTDEANVNKYMTSQTLNSLLACWHGWGGKGQR